MININTFVELKNTFMKKTNTYLILFILTFIILLSLNCKRNTNKTQKIIFSGYSIPREWARLDMKLDSITPLKELIPKLRIYDTLYETGKAYWIGYNDLMFSIAVYADSAINPLINFIDTTNSTKAQIAALYTLHLIGINCKVASRTLEKFDNLKAREALLKVLSTHINLQRNIMLLLIRDPRENDIPKLFNIMESSDDYCWAISAALLSYNLNNIPIHQPIPEKLLNKSVDIKFNEDNNYNEMYKKVFRAFSDKYKGLVNVEDTLFNYNFHQPTFINSKSEPIKLWYLIFESSRINYCELSSNYQYYFKNGKIYFCSAMTSKKLWLDWWKLQSKSYKDNLTHIATIRP